jgi:hypothetical protein
MVRPTQRHSTGCRLIPVSSKQWRVRQLAAITIRSPVGFELITVRFPSKRGWPVLPGAVAFAGAGARIDVPASPRRS